MITDLLTDLGKYYVHHDPAPVNLSLKRKSGRDIVVIHDAPHAVVEWVYSWMRDNSNAYPATTAHLTSEGLVIS